MRKRECPVSRRGATVDLISVLLIVVGGVILMTMVTSVAVIGVDSLRAARKELRYQLRESGPYIVGLAVIYGLNKLAHEFSDPIAAVIGIEITDTLLAIEGEFVAGLQGLFPDSAVWFFAFAYVFGFAFLLIFPIVAYLLLPTQRHLKELLVAFIINYSAGTVFYTMFIAYGPRNALPNIVAQPMFDTFPEIMVLTSAINTSSNVFPSLHTSLVITVLIFAWYTREEYPRWLSVCAFFTISIVISTMYLGIHWAIDVVAGVILAAASVYLSRRFVAWAENRKGTRSTRTSRMEAETQD
jgi:membrane-associated phospholipid phosphatase